MRTSASVQANRLAHDKSQERERVHLILIADAQRGLADIAAGRTVEADTAIAQRQLLRAGSR